MSLKSDSFHFPNHTVLWKWKFLSSSLVKVNVYLATQEVLWRHLHLSSSSLHTRLMSPFQHWVWLQNVFHPLDFRWFTIFYLKHLLPRFIISSCFFSPEPSVLYPWPVIPWRQVSTRFIGPLCFILWIKAQNRVGKYHFCNQLSAKLADESCAGKNKMWTFIGSCQRNILHCGLWRISQNSQMHDHM